MIDWDEDDILGGIISSLFSFTSGRRIPNPAHPQSIIMEGVSRAYKISGDVREYELQEDRHRAYKILA